MKKITALLVILSLCVVMLAACSDNKETQVDNGGEKSPADTQQLQNDTTPVEVQQTSDPIDPADEAAEVADSFMEAYAKFDFESAAQYVDDPTVFENPVIAMVSNPDALMQSILEASGLSIEEFPYASYFSPAFVTLVDRIKTGVSFEKIACDTEDDKYVVIYKTTSPDIASFTDALAIIGTAFTEASFAEKAIELLESGVLTESTTEEEAVDAVCKAIADDFADAVFNAELQLTESEGTVVLKKVDDKWLIITEDSNF